MITERPIMPLSLAGQLLDDYVAGSSFFFATPQRTLLARGVYASVRHEQGPAALAHLPARVAAALDQARQEEHDIPLVVGALPFDDQAPAQLVIPQTIGRAGPLLLDSAAAPAQPPAAGCSLRPEPDPAAYARGVAQALELIEAGELRKVVLARTLLLRAPAPIDMPQLLRNLATRNPCGYTFAVDLPARGLRTLIGASPELLVARAGMQVHSNPLAGSAPRSPDPAEDERRAAALLASAKDRHEHAVVVEAVAEALRPYCRRLDVPSAPSLTSTPTMWHLSTQVRGELADPAITALELALALHPTPAVCGQPTALARTAIREIEPFDRGFYTGAVGWCDASGDGRWAVAIRCAEATEQTLRLYAGAGIVAGSRPQDEVAETEAKFRTMLHAMGLRPATGE